VTEAPPVAPLDVPAIRALFSALGRREDGREAVFFDGPAGSQVPRSVIDAVADAMAHANANTHGLFATSRAVDRLLQEARRSSYPSLSAASRTAWCG
jgi:selenocysteine lyase/cysteine desulfurase